MPLIRTESLSVEQLQQQVVSTHWVDPVPTAPLVRQNAKSTEELNKIYNDLIENDLMTKPFREYFSSPQGQEHVRRFFSTMSKTCYPETMKKFSRYHTKERFDIFREMFPPPGDMREIWNAWTRKGRPDIV